MQGFQITSARDIQRNYRKLFDSVKKTRKPLFVMKGTDVEVVIVDPKSYEEMQRSLEEKRTQTDTGARPGSISNSTPGSVKSPTISLPTISRVPWRK